MGVHCQAGSEEARSVCMCKGERSRVGFALLLLSPLLAFLGPREQALAGALVAAGWHGGARGAWCDILPSFVGSIASVSALLRAVLRKARLTLEQWLWEGEMGRRRPGWGAKDILPAFRGPMEPRACAGV